MANRQVTMIGRSAPFRAGLALLLLAVPGACAKKPNLDVVGDWRCTEVQPAPYETQTYTMTIRPSGKFHIDNAEGDLEHGKFAFSFSASGRISTPDGQFIARFKTVDVHSAAMDGVEYSAGQKADVAREMLNAVGYFFTIDQLTDTELTVHDKTSHTACTRVEGNNITP